MSNKFPESGTTERGMLMYASLVLLGITLLVNLVGTAILRRASLYPQGAAK